MPLKRVARTLAGRRTVGEIRGRFRRGGERDGSEAGGEIWEITGIFLVEMTILPRTLVEIKRVTQRVVLELPSGVAVVVMAVVITTAVKAADEGLPLRASDDLGPFSNLLEGGEGAGPPTGVVLGVAEAVPEGGGGIR